MKMVKYDGEGGYKGEGFKKKKGLSHPRSIPILTKYKPV